MPRPVRKLLLSEDEAVIQKVAGFLQKKIPDSILCETLAIDLLRGAEGGLEFEELNFDEWFEGRFKQQLVWLDAKDYARALVRALWLAPKFAGTDYGSSRQRDMAQVWTDTARGFLGEIAFSIFLSNTYGIETKVDATRGLIEAYLATDIAEVKLPGEQWRSPRETVSVKATKFNGRWLDVPGAQIEHSNSFVLVKIGVSRAHFLAFLKNADFLDKLVSQGKDLEELKEEDSQKLLSEIPDFYPLPAYIAGYISKRDVTLPIHMLNARLKGRKLKRIVIAQGVGLLTPEVIRAYPSILTFDPAGVMVIEIEPIIKSFSGQKFLAHSGSLKYGKGNWGNLSKLF